MTRRLRLRDSRLPWQLGCSEASKRAQRVWIGDRRGLDIERNVNPDRAGAAVQREVMGLLELKADVERVEHDYSVFRDRLDDGDDVDLLHAELTHAQRLASDSVEHAVGALDLAGEEDCRRGIQPGASYSSDGIGSPGAGGDESHPKTAHGLRVALRADRGGLFMRVADRRNSFFRGE